MDGEAEGSAREVGGSLQISIPDDQNKRGAFVRSGKNICMGGSGIAVLFTVEYSYGWLHNKGFVITSE